MIVLPTDHPLRAYVNDEMHARPADQMSAPLRIAYLALFSDPAAREQEWQQLRDLVARFGMSLPAAALNHYSADVGPFRLRWERHTEFVRYTFIVARGPDHGHGDSGSGGDGDGGLDDASDLLNVLADVPADWLGQLTGRTIVATQVAFFASDEDSFDADELALRYFAGHALVGASIAGGAAIAVTDFRVHSDGFGRLLLFDQGLTARQGGRLLQLLLELDTYRLLALLALPVARELAPQLSLYEQELSAVTTALTHSVDADESGLLDRLTRLEAQIESRESSTLYRFDAAAAYYELVQSRIGELREIRMNALPTFQEFLERRLAPAMHTCRSVAARLESLSQRVARANQLLATRVDITRERQNQALLASMNRRAQAQLRLQQTVEGLSIAAVTYYIVGLIGYAAKGLNSAGLQLDPEIASAAGIPLVALLVAYGVYKARRGVRRAEH